MSISAAFCIQKVTWYTFCGFCCVPRNYYIKGIYCVIIIWQQLYKWGFVGNVKIKRLALSIIMGLIFTFLTYRLSTFSKDIYCVITIWQQLYKWVFVDNVKIKRVTFIIMGWPILSWHSLLSQNFVNFDQFFSV